MNTDCVSAGDRRNTGGTSTDDVHAKFYENPSADSDVISVGDKHSHDNS